MKLLIKNGMVINPAGRSGKLDILIQEGKVEEIAAGIQAQARTVDASGCWVMPGLIDMHCHLREPGFEYKEDIRSGSAAAVYGGYTAVACMPNTKPVADDPAIVSYIRTKANEAGYARVYPIAAITKGMEGKELSEMGLLLSAGAVAFSDDGKPVAEARRMQLALQYAKNYGALLIAHCEDLSLSAGGAMNEGVWSVALGLKGIPHAAEEIMVARDILLAESYGARVHIAHVSTCGSVELIRAAKARGVAVTAETAPHYFSATEEWLKTYDTNAKMSPPLRTQQDVEAVIRGLADGALDAIATDHAPHCPDEKRVEFSSALNGIVGFETAFSLGVTNLVQPGHITKERLVELMSASPARILGVPGGEIKEGCAADITIAKPDEAVTYTALHSKSWNSPFLHKAYSGRVKAVVIGGEVVLNEETLTRRTI